MKCPACGHEDIKSGGLTLEQQVKILTWALRVRRDTHVDWSDINQIPIDQMVDPGVFLYHDAPKLTEDFGVQVLSIEPIYWDGSWDDSTSSS